MIYQTQPRFGIILCGDLASGGIFSYENAIIEVLSESTLDLVFFFESGKERRIFPPNIEAITYKVTFMDKVRKLVLANSRIIPRFLATKFFLSSLERKLLKSGISVAYFASPNHIASIFQRIPMINTVWDLGHRDLPEYPEFRSLQIYRNRENYLSEVLPRSIHVFTDSEATSKKISEIYGVDSSRITNLGLFPRIISKQKNLEKSLKRDVVVYAANFWPHKNHEALFQAMDAISKRYSCKLVLVSSSGVNASEFLDRMRALYPDVKFNHLVGLSKLDLERQIAEAKVLVMPSSLGPTNLPPLEALLLGTKIVISDAHLDREILVNPNVKVINPLNISEFSNAILESLLRPKFITKKKKSDKNEQTKLLDILAHVASKVR